MNLRETLADADRRRVAIGHFNVSELGTLSVATVGRVVTSRMRLFSS